MITEIPWDKSGMEWKPVDLTVMLRDDAEDALVSAIIGQTLTRPCLIAAMFAGVGKVTAGHRILKNPSG